MKKAVLLVKGRQMNINIYLRERTELINNTLDQLLSDEADRPFVLFKAMRYSLFAGGKRLRPILFLAVLETLDQKIEQYLPFACALELIHTYSLIHDDLPAMDNDDFRRGLPTCHKKFGEAQAILAGDALLTYAFNLMIKPRASGVPSDLLLMAIDEVAFGAGIKGMIAGQVVDIESENKKINLEELKYIHKHKTGALFLASVRSGAILAGADYQQLASLTLYGEELGLAFQITDDILDVVGNADKLGKPVGSDVRNQKATYPGLLGLDNSRVLAQQAVKNALKALDSFDEKAAPLREIVKLLLTREN
jgi:geranylgeranyl diphosphate synthase type II